MAVADISMLSRPRRYIIPLGGTAIANTEPDTVPCRTRNKPDRSELTRQRSVGAAPGVDAAMDVAGARYARVLSRLRRHGRTLPERAVEQDALAGGAGELVQHAARADVLLQVGVGRMQGTWDHPMLLTLTAFAQVDQSHVRL